MEQPIVAQDATAQPQAGAGTVDRVPMEEQQEIRLRPQNRILRDIPRYVVMAGDVLPPLTKRVWREIEGYQLGGMWQTPVHAPALWKFKGFITRGRLTPLIKRPTQAHNSEQIARKKLEDIAEIVEKGGEVTQEMTRAYRMAYPWDTLQSLLSPHLQRKGIVHVTALDGVAWEAGDVQKIQSFFFPNWDELVRGDAELPILVQDFKRYIESRRHATDEHLIQDVADAYLASAEAFEQYAEAVVGQAKRAVARGMNDKGYLAPITPLARHLARQVGAMIEESTVDIIKQTREAQPQQTGHNDELLSAVLEQNKVLTAMVEKLFGATEATAPAPAKDPEVPEIPDIPEEEPQEEEVEPVAGEVEGSDEEQ